MSRKRHHVDVDASIAAHFEDERSYITLDGKEYRFGADKTARRRQIFGRDGYRCYYCKRRVTWDMGEWHHDPPLSKGGDDSLAGGKTACAPCHRREDGRYPRWSKRAVAAVAGGLNG